MSIFYGAEEIHVDVADDGSPRGRRLLGMRERVAVYGGELTTSAAPDASSPPSAGGASPASQRATGWRVSARLPVAATS